MALTFRDLFNSCKQLHPDPSRPLIVHAPKLPGIEVRGGEETLLGALLAVSDGLVMPSFTFRSTVIPEDGPENNGITYGSGDKTNLMADFFSPALPVDPNLGRLPEVLRQHPHTVRSSHPILSFCSIHADEIVNSQTLEDPLSPLENLYRLNGQVLLLGCGQSSNFSVHLGEKHAGRKGFIRWAITPAAVVECSGIPGCPDGFEELDLALQDEIHRVQIGTFEARSMRIITLVDLVEQLVRENPLALLCSRTECERCSAIRNSLEQGPNP